MSIKGRMQSFELQRADTTPDAYGIMSSTPSKITDIQVAVSKNTPAHDRVNPSYDITPYIGITAYIGVQEGDTLISGAGNYQVVNVGDRGTQYQALFLIKI